MAFISKDDLKSLYNTSKTEAHIWREDYPAYERLANNDLMDNLDPNLPEVNDGSLAAALFKLPKRIVPAHVSGSVTATDSKNDWLSEFATIYWDKHMIPHANTQAPFLRKWKDAVRKAGVYGSVPLITLTTERNGQTYTDFIVGQPQDVTLEPGKVSDYDSDVLFWDVYYTNLQWDNMIEQAKEETKEHDSNMAAYKAAKVTKPIGTTGSQDTDEPPKPYNTWDIPGMETIRKGDFKEERSSLDTPRQEQDKAVRPTGIKICITFQRGVNAPFYMYHSATDTAVREWSNPDPTGDVPIHFLYCYQDFINPYGIGIVKLAGGTQNVLDYMRQADVLATQLGLRPPLNIQGNTDDLDVDSLVYAQDAMWFTGQAIVKREEMSNAVYTQLPSRIEMYQGSLNKLIPTGDTSVSSGSGDPTQSKTPAGVKLQAANLSIDDEDFKDNFFVTYQAVAKSMINTHFANMEGSDFVNLTDDERQLLIKAGLDFPQTADGEMSNQLEVVWDTVRSNFDFTVDASGGAKATDSEQAQSIMDALGLITPQVSYYMAQDGWKFNSGEAYYNVFRKMNLDNVDKIITKMTDEETAEAQKAPFPIIDPPQIRLTGQIPNSAMGAALQQGGVTTDPNAPMIQDSVDLGDIYKDPSTGPGTKAAIQQMAGLPPDVVQPPVVTPGAQAPTAQQPASPATPAQQPQMSQEQIQANVNAVMEQYGVDETTALTALAAEAQGFRPEDVIKHLQSLKQGAPA